MKKDEVLTRLEDLETAVANGEDVAVRFAEIGKAIDNLADQEDVDKLERDISDLETDLDEATDQLEEKKVEDERPYVNHLLDGKSPMSWLTDPERNR